MKRYILALFLFFLCSVVFSQSQKSAKQNTVRQVVETVGENMNPYGSYRINFGVNDDGYVGMADNASRFGISGALPLNNSLKAIAVIELGARLVDYDETIVFRGDPGYQFGEGNSNLFGRLGYVGIKHKYFSFTVGKQWSAYYDVAAYTDMLYAFGGEASGAFNNGTDGGISGTGRANQLFLLRTHYKNFHLALQMQARHLTENSKRIGDTYGGSIQYISKFGLKIGFALNIVNDGLDNPLPNEHKSGDKAYVSSIGYEINNFYFAVTYSQFYQHELLAITDSTSVYFDGFGSEFYAGYTFGRDQQWRASLLMNTMWPEKGQSVDKYKMLYFVGEFSYAFGEESRIFLSIKEDFNSDRFGNSSEETIWAMGFRFSFGY
jgi:predicted porin